MTIINVLLALPKIISGIEGVIKMVRDILFKLQVEREKKKTVATDKEIKEAMLDTKNKIARLNALLDS